MNARVNSPEDMPEDLTNLLNKLQDEGAKVVVIDKRTNINGASGCDDPNCATCGPIEMLAELDKRIEEEDQLTGKVRRDIDREVSGFLARILCSTVHASADREFEGADEKRLIEMDVRAQEIRNLKALFDARIQAPKEDKAEPVKA